MTRSRLLVALLLAGGCGAVAVAVGISTSAAATSHQAARASSAGGWPGYRPDGATGGVGPRSLRSGGFEGRRGVIHSVVVVPNASGGFDTVTIDSGVLKSISGDMLTITEGTTSATYATPTITVGSGATVVLDGKASTLSALLAGDRVTISRNSDGTTRVSAADSSLAPRYGLGPRRSRGFGGRLFGGPPPGGATGATGVWRPRSRPGTPLWGGATGASGTVA